MADCWQRIERWPGYIDDPARYAQAVTRRRSKHQRGATPKRHRPSRGKAQAERSKSACTQRLRNHPSRQTRYATPQFARSDTL